MNGGKTAIAGLAAILLAACGAMAGDVFNSGGTRNPDGSWNGLASLETVPVGNPGNAPDTRYDPNGFGGVAYAYRIGEYEVTSGQYCEFLNAVAATDTYGLYNTHMWSTISECRLHRSGSPGSYTYDVASDWANRPVNYVSWGDAARFCNWLANDQPTGAQDLTTTEDGSYFLNGATSVADLMAVTRKGGATWVIPSEDEWYKAAYHKNDGGTGNYFDYPTSGNAAPGQDMNDASGNNANYYTTPYHWPIDHGKCTTLVGEFENSESPYGTFDQGGNVAEWDEAILYPYGSPYRGVRGGCFGDARDKLLAADRDGLSPEVDSGIIGFRVVQIPEPFAAATLGLGWLAFLIRRHR